MAKATNNVAPVAAPLVEGPAHKYAQGAGKAPCADVSFALTAQGATFAAHGNGKQGKPTVPAVLAMAARLAGATQDNAVKGADIIKTVVSNAETFALLQRCKVARYMPGGTYPCTRWLSDYVTGFAKGIDPLFARKAG